MQARENVLQRRDPTQGYATDFVELIRRILPRLRERRIRVVANAGGVNPEACRAALFDVAREQGATGLKIGTVRGDDILDQLDELMQAGATLAHMEDDRPLTEIRDRVLSANVYINSFCAADALSRGADIVVTGRSTDPGLVLAPLIAEFGWRPDQWYLLAAGTVAAERSLTPRSHR